VILDGTIVILDVILDGTILEVMIHILVSCYHMYLHVNDDDVFYDDSYQR
jgi:hypothetical protein